MQDKIIVIKIDDNRPLSRHTLDLKKNSGQSKKARVKIAGLDTHKNPFNDLFIFGFIKTLAAAIFFLPCQAGRGMCGAADKTKHAIKSFKINFSEAKKNISNARPIVLDFMPPPRWSRGILAFAMVAFIIILPIKAMSSFEELLAQKDAIMAQGLKGYEELKKNDFSAAGASFASAKQTINDLGTFFKTAVSLVPGVGDKLSFGNGILVFGENISRAADILSGAIKYFDEKTALTEKIKNFNSKIGEAMPNLLVADRVLSILDKSAPILPFDLGPIKDALHDSVKALLVFQNFSATLVDILGGQSFKRYLFVFQNNNEIRPTGGFIGSFAVIDVDRGEIAQMQIPGGGSYDIKGQLTELVISPEPFHLINSAWQFQDSNWFPDFPEAAKKMMWFYEKSGGPSVDGVVAVNATLMEEFLKIIGPIEMAEYGRVMTAENFIDETQKIVELEYDKTINKPKQVIADMAPKVLERLSKINGKELSEFSQVIRRAILEKDILVYATNEDMEAELESFGLSGKLKDISGITDYLMLVDTNIAGQKTDGKIIKELSHISEIGSDGSITNTVKITRRHTGVKGALFSGVRNVNYLRLYVPQGAEFLEATGFTAPPGGLFKPVREGYSKDLDLKRVEGTAYVDPKSGTRVNNEFGRTVFGNWIMVDPGQEVVVIFKYKLLNRMVIARDGGYKESLGLTNNFSTYTMLIEKQPGAKNTFFKSSVKLNNEKTVARVGAGVALQNDGWQYETSLISDKYYGVVVEN